jgi:hypothetical protein
MWDGNRLMADSYGSVTQLWRLRILKAHLFSPVRVHCKDEILQLNGLVKRRRPVPLRHSRALQLAPGSRCLSSDEVHFSRKNAHHLNYRTVTYQISKYNTTDEESRHDGLTVSAHNWESGA